MDMSDTVPQQRERWKLVRASDPKEQALREDWYTARDEMEAGTSNRFHAANERLAKYLWNRAQAEREADRIRHPKAKRNLVSAEKGGGGRALP
jgi:hypothetical protein